MSRIAYKTGRIGICTQKSVLALEGSVLHVVQLLLNVLVHDLQSGGQDDVGIAVNAIIVLVGIAADYIYRLVSSGCFLNCSEHTVSGCTCCNKDNITAIADQSLADDLSGCFICEGANIVAAYVCTGNIGSCICRLFNTLRICAVVLVRILHAAHKAVLVVYVGRICNSVDNSNLAGLCCHCSCNTCKEAGLLLLEGHGIYVVILSFVAVRIGRVGIYQDEINIRVLLCDRSDSSKLEAAAYDNIIICNNSLYGLVAGSGIAGLFLDRGYLAVRVLSDECLNSLIVVLVEGTIIYAGRRRNDCDVQSCALVSCLCSLGSSLRGSLFGSFCLCCSLCGSSGAGGILCYRSSGTASQKCCRHCHRAYHANDFFLHIDPPLKLNRPSPRTLRPQ